MRHLHQRLDSADENVESVNWFSPSPALLQARYGDPVIGETPIFLDDIRFSDNTSLDASSVPNDSDSSDRSSESDSLSEDDDDSDEEAKSDAKSDADMDDLHSAQGDSDSGYGASHSSPAKDAQLSDVLMPDSAALTTTHSAAAVPSFGMSSVTPPRPPPKPPAPPAPTAPDSIDDVPMPSAASSRGHGAAIDTDSTTDIPMQSADSDNQSSDAGMVSVSLPASPSPVRVPTPPVDDVTRAFLQSASPSPVSQLSSSPVVISDAKALLNHCRVLSMNSDDDRADWLPAQRSSRVSLAPASSDSPQPGDVSSVPANALTMTDAEKLAWFDRHIAASSGAASSDGVSLAPTSQDTNASVSPHSPIGPDADLTPTRILPQRSYRVHHMCLGILKRLRTPLTSAMLTFRGLHQLWRAYPYHDLHIASKEDSAGWMVNGRLLDPSEVRLLGKCWLCPACDMVNSRSELTCISCDNQLYCDEVRLCHECGTVKDLNGACRCSDDGSVPQLWMAMDDRFWHCLRCDGIGVHRYKDRLWHIPRTCSCPFCGASFDSSPGRHLTGKELSCLSPWIGAEDTSLEVPLTLLVEPKEADLRLLCEEMKVDRWYADQRLFRWKDMMTFGCCFSDSCHRPCALPDQMCNEHAALAISAAVQRADAETVAYFAHEPLTDTWCWHRQSREPPVSPTSSSAGNVSSKDATDEDIDLLTPADLLLRLRTLYRGYFVAIFAKHDPSRVSDLPEFMAKCDSSRQALQDALEQLHQQYRVPFSDVPPLHPDSVLLDMDLPTHRTDAQLIADYAATSPQPAMMPRALSPSPLAPHVPVGSCCCDTTDGRCASCRRRLAKSHMASMERAQPGRVVPTYEKGGHPHVQDLEREARVDSVSPLAGEDSDPGTHRLIQSETRPIADEPIATESTLSSAEHAIMDACLNRLRGNLSPDRSPTSLSKSWSLISAPNHSSSSPPTTPPPASTKRARPAGDTPERALNRPGVSVKKRGVVLSGDDSDAADGHPPHQQIRALAASVSDLQAPGASTTASSLPATTDPSDSVAQAALLSVLPNLDRQFSPAPADLTMDDDVEQFTNEVPQVPPDAIDSPPDTSPIAALPDGATSCLHSL